MPKFEIVLSIEIEADDANAAFADVRTNYCVVNDPLGKVTEKTVSFLIDDQIHELAEDEEDAA